MNKNIFETKNNCNILVTILGIIISAILVFSGVMMAKANYISKEKNINRAPQIEQMAKNIERTKYDNLLFWDTAKQNEIQIFDSTNKDIETNSLTLEQSQKSIANSSSSITIDGKSGKVLSCENQNARLPMASTTKIVTALVAIENGKCNDYVTIDKRAVGTEGSSIYIKEGQKWKLIDLLYGLMLRSGNDSAEMIAIAVGGNRDNFIKMMNEKAKSLGLTNTNFTNPSGLHDDNHYTSAYDLAMLTAEAYKYTLFEQIVSSGKHTTEVVYESDGKEVKYDFFNKNKMLNIIEGANGVKTGYTKKAGRCLVSAVKRDNVQLISVVLNIGDMWNYSKYLLETAMHKYEKVLITKAGDTVGYFHLAHTVDSLYPAVIKNDVYIYRLKGEEKKLEYRFIQNKNIFAAPLPSDSQVGILEISCAKQLIFSAKAYNINNIQNIYEEIRLRPLTNS